MEKKIYDLIIIGAGPAGLGASIYASRYKLDHIVIGNEIGGQVVEAAEIENWAGEISISGRDLMGKFEQHARHLGAEIIQEDIANIDIAPEGFRIFSEKNEYSAKSIILALGMKARKMNVPGEDKFIGKGVSFCATCDAMFFREKDVVVIGGGDAAATAAIHLADFASSVKILYRDTCNWEPSWEELINKNPKIEKICCTDIKEIKGDAKVSGIAFEENGQEKELPVQGVFIEIGSTPGVAVAKELGIKLDEQGYIIVGEDQQTNIENIFAAGDATNNSNKFRQIITAVAEGAIAAGSAYRKLKLGKK